MSCQFVYAVRADFSRCNVAVPDDPRNAFGIAPACIVFLLIKLHLFGMRSTSALRVCSIKSHM